MKFPLLVLLAAGALSAPFNNYDFVGVPETKCDNPRRLAEHSTTLFDYEGETLSTIQGSTPDSTGIRMRATIYVHPQGACRFSMQINNAELFVKSKNTKGFSPAAESLKFARELEANDIVFETANGKIERLFPNSAESLHILNIKRGILSTLQVGENNAEEIDVNGRCKVSITEENGMIVKSKNLSECSERTHSEIGFHTASFENKELPIKPLNSTSRCVIKTVDEKITNVECTEAHIFRPFSAGFETPSGAMTFVTQKLKFAGEKRGSVAANFEIESKSEGVSLVYEHDAEHMKPVNSIVDRIDKVMARLVSNKVDMGVKQQSAQEFTQLVSLLRKVDNKRMTPVMEKYFNCDKSGICKPSETDLKSVYRQYFLDALTYCATPSCVSAVNSIIMEDGLSGESMNMFLQGISLVAKPTKGMIRDVKEIASRKPSRQAFLTLGILMFRYCSSSPDQCAYSKSNPITLAELFLEDKLGNGCNGQENLDRVEEILMALKAIGNAGRPFRAWRTLLTCAKSAVHQNITTAALDALRRMPCNAEMQTRIHEIHENINMDPEKRIKAYLALMRCPSEETIKRITSYLQKEKSKHVGSFIWSHLKNVNESSDPRHARTQEILAIVLKGKDLKEFNLPLTQFSKAFEASAYMKYLKSGGSVDGHLIYHPDSILPRSALINVTANILEVPVNVFEMAARVEGIETLIEDFFGPEGMFKDNVLVNVFNYTFSSEDRAKLRSRRSTGSDKMSDNIKRLHEQVNKKRVQPSGSLSMKVLGHEMRVFSYDDIFWAVDQIDNMNVIDLLLKVAKGGHKTFTKSVMFMEMSHSVPTGLGLPIKLNLKGSAVGSVELDGKFDIRNMFWGPRSMEIKGYVRPSAVVEVSGRMGVNSHYVDTGILVNSSMFTSQMIKGSVAYKEGKLLKINIDAPERPIEIFNVSSTPFLFANEEIQLIQGAPRRLSPDFCLKSKMVLGLGLCTSMSLPVAFREYESPYFPLSGPAHFGMKIIKADPKLTTYQVSVSLTKKPIYNGHELIGAIQFGTPGATYSRGMTSVVKYQETDKVRRLIIGEFQNKNSAELLIQYHNNTNRFEADFRTNIITSKTSRARFVFFNESSDESKKIGVFTSLSYDWYKLQQTTDFTRTESTYSVTSKTTYYPGNHVTAKATYSVKDKDMMIKLESDRSGSIQAIQMNGRYLKTETERGLNFTVKHIPSEKTSSVYFGAVNAENEKKILVNTTCFLGNKQELSLGYYRKKFSHIIALNAKAMNKEAAIFADFANAENGWYGFEVGAKYEKKIIGLMSTLNRGSNGNGEACTTMYYNDKTPVKSCLTLKKVSSAVRRLVWTTEIMKRAGEVAFEFSNMDSTKGLTTTVKYNEKELIKNTMTFMYKSLWENELKNLIEIGQRSVVARMYTENLNNNVAFGVEAKAYGKLVRMQATYSTKSEADSTSYFVTVEGWVNKKLPASYVAALKYGQQEMGLQSILAIKDYKMTSYISWRRAPSGKRTMTRFFGVTRNEANIFSADISDTLSVNQDTKFFKTELRLNFGERSFKYGWDVTLVNRCTESRSAYAITFGLDYAQKRRSSITASISNDNKKAMLVVDFMYIPGKQVTQMISYDKVNRQLDISIEFLPRMFVKVMGRLDKENGWKFTTDLKFSWSNYERVMTWVAAYVDKSKFQALSFRFLAFNKQFLVASEYNKDTKTMIFTISAFGRSMKVTGYYLKDRKVMGLKLTTEAAQGNVLVPKEIIEAVVSYSEKSVAFELRRQNVRYINTIATLDKTSGKASFEIFVLERRMLKTIGVFDRSRGLTSFELIVREKSMFKVEGQLKRPEALMIVRLFVLGKERFQTIAKYNKERKTALLSLDALRKNLNAVFAAKWNPDRKEITLSTEVLKRHFGVIARFDPINYVIAGHVFYQKHLAGLTTLLDTKNMAVVYNVTLTPRLSGQVVMQILQDRIIAVTVQRKFGQQIVNEASFKYELGSDASKLIFHWNKDTTNMIRNKVKDVIIPSIKSAMDKASDVASKVSTSGQKIGMELVKNGTTQILRLIDEVDRRFDDIDFDLIKDKTGEVVVAALKKTAELTNKALRLTSEIMTKAHTKLPEMMEFTRNYARKSVELAETALKESRVLMKEANRIAQIAYNVAKNLTESGAPVVKTAIKLAKEFKVRGKTMEQIVSDVIKMSEKLVKEWRKTLSVKIEEARRNAIVYIREMPVPYRKEKLGELYAMYMKKFEEFRSTFDLKQKMREVSRKIMEYRIKGMTVEEHYKDIVKRAKNAEIEIKKVLKNLPEDVKKIAVKMIGESRMYVKKIKKIVKKVDAFAQPLVRCVKRLAASIEKHFGPLVTMAIKESRTSFITEYTKIYRPVKAAVLQVIDIIEKFITPLVKPMKPLYQEFQAQLRAIRILEKELGPLVDFYISQLKSALQARFDAEKLRLKACISSKKEMITKVYNMLAKMTPEQIVVFTVDKSMQLGIESIKYTRALYKARKEIITRWKERAESAYAEAKKIYAIATSKPVEEMIHTAFQMTGEAAIKTIKEFAKTIDQIASMDISKPLEKAWREMDLLNHLERYGVNSNIAKAIRIAKSVNLTEALFNTIKVARITITKAVAVAEQRYERAYRVVEAVYKYVSAIPKMNFEDFYTELEEFYMKNNELAYTIAKNLIKEGRAKIIKAIETVKRMYVKYLEKYGKPVMKVYETLKERAILVRDENKEQIAFVFDLYRDIIKGVTKEYYTIARKYAETRYVMLRDLAEKKYEMARKYVIAKYEECYQKCLDFYRQYEDKTWEMIGEELYKMTEKHYNTASDLVTVEMKKARVQVDKLIAQANALYAKATRIVKKYVALAKSRYENEVKPKIERMYSEAVIMYNKVKGTVLKKYDEYSKYSVDVYNKIYSDVIAIYRANKALSIRQLYRKIIAIVYKRINEQVTMMRAMTKKYYEQTYETIKSKVMELKQKADKIRADVMPIVLFEAESIFNQTLRAYVIIANETVKAYTPHFNIVKAFAIEYYGKGARLAKDYYRDGVDYATKQYAVVKVKSLDMLKRSRVELDEQIKKLVEYVKELIVKMKNHPKYQEIMEHKYTKQAIKMIKDLKTKMEPKIAELKAKMIEYREKMEPKIAELKARIEELRNHPKVAEMKLKIAEYRQKIMALREHPYVLQAIKILKQIQGSGLFTIMKIESIIMPHIKTVEKKINEIPSVIVYHAKLFRRDPAECVWIIVSNVKSLAKDIMSYDWKSIDAMQMSKDLIVDITDERTKEFAKKTQLRAVECYRKCQEYAKTVPKMIREKATEIYKKQIEMIRKLQGDLMAAWKQSPLNPIVNHEIWGDLVAEVRNHEIVSGMVSLAKQGKYMLDAYRTMYMRKIEKFIALKKAEIKAKYEAVIGKVNTFLDETTLEDIVNKAVDSFEIAKAKIEEGRQKLMVQVNKAYEIARSKYITYKEKAMIVGKKYHSKAEEMWKMHYPRAAQKAKLMYEKARTRLDKAIKDLTKYTKDMKEKAVTRSLKLWNESDLKRNLITLKGMTVGETVAEIKKLPQKAKVMYRKALKIAQGKVEELRARYDEHLRPHVMKVERVARAVFDEVNATAVFVYRYYNLRGNMYRARDYVKGRMMEVKEYIKENAKKYQEYTVRRVKETLPKIRPAMRFYAKQLAKASLRSLHTAMVHADNFDIKPYIAKIKMLKKYVPDFNKYIILDAVSNELIFRIPHYKPVEPSFSYQIKKVDTSVRMAANKITRDTVELTKRMIQYARNKTAELREDLNASMIAHSEFGRYFYKRAADVSAKVWSRSLQVSQKLNETLRERFEDAKQYIDTYSKQAMKKGKKVSTAILSFTKDAVIDVTYSNGIGDAYTKAERYAKTAFNTIKTELTPSYEAAKAYAKAVYRDMELRYKMIMYKARPYYLIVKTAAKEWRNGAEFRQAFRVVEVQLRKAYKTASSMLRERMDELKTITFDAIEQEDVRVLKEYLSSHRTILGKYFRRLYRLYRIGKVKIDKALRKGKLLLRKQWKKQSIAPFRSVAMIFGKNHVMTFDGKFYDLPQFTKSSCTYLLARDFKNGNFTILSQKENIIIQTPDMEVIIHQSGRVTSSVRVSKNKKVEIRDLPVESESGFCKAKRDGVSCEFKQGLAVYCDNKHFLCTIQLSGMHYGSTQGLLGSNNNEVYDDFRLPGSTITESVSEFANSWLVTRTQGCMVKEESNEAPLCNKAPSERCFAHFKDSKSKFSSVFSAVDPLPFLKACLLDTADCESKQHSSIAHCNATEAYIRTLRMKGYYAPRPAECMAYQKADGKFVEQGEKWIEPLSNDVDVVILMSKRVKSRSLSRTLALSVFSINRRLAKRGFNTRYALVGFGGSEKQGEPLVHTIRGGDFSDAGRVSSVIKEMSYTGKPSDNNDAYAAIDLASKLRFRPGARKVFMLFNFDEYKPSFFGPSLDETIVHLKARANATLVVFDDFKFKPYGKSRVIGQTETRVYLSPDYQAVPMTDYQMPRSSFTKLVRVSDGAMFINSFQPTESKIMTTAVVDALLDSLNAKSSNVQCCRLHFYHPKCKISKPTTC